MYRNINIKSIIKEAKNEGIKVESIYSKLGAFVLKKGNKKRYIITSSSYPGNSSVAATITKEKMISKIILSKDKMKTPTGYEIFTASKKKPISFFLERFKFPFVLKQSNASLSKNVILVKNMQELSEARKFFYKKKIDFIAERYIKGSTHRFLIIKGKIVAAIKYVPANIIGDGKHTIKKLIEIKNKDPRRGKGKCASMHRITIDRIARRYLKKQKLKLSSIPDKDQLIYLGSDLEMSYGLDTIDCTDYYHKNYQAICYEIYKDVPELKIIGADIISTDITKDPDKVGYSIIEINSRPDFSMHENPYIGKKRNIAKDILKVMFED